ncbi:MAG: hypothetical protein R3E79_10960 [Caldilineaceae bacterium]
MSNSTGNVQKQTEIAQLVINNIYEDRFRHKLLVTQIIRQRVEFVNLRNDSACRSRGNPGEGPAAFRYVETRLAFPRIAG